MPWTNDQQIAARIAEHEPKKLYKRNRSFLSMSAAELHRMASEPLKKKKSALAAANQEREN